MNQSSGNPPDYPYIQRFFWCLFQRRWILVMSWQVLLLLPATLSGITIMRLRS
ncbi:BnaC03g42620D [Brassica napus]|uniref:BnaC03g42620D protein n=1 Tax=Brassica napus TaxID=3708 RepID=A0A078GG15_BRANA|nr:BnaC03g42620D [Brassica napus]